MDTEWPWETVPVVEASTPIGEIARLMAGSRSPLVAVKGSNGELSGVIDVFSILGHFAKRGPPHLTAIDVMKAVPGRALGQDGFSAVELARLIARSQEAEPSLTSADGRGLEVVSAEKILSGVAEGHESNKGRLEGMERLYWQALEEAPLGIALFDERGETAYVNKAARDVLACIETEKRNSFDTGGFEDSIVIEAGQRRLRIQATRCDIGVHGESSRTSRLLVFTDVTAEHALITSMERARQETEMALSITLPDIRVVDRLRSIPEYRDEAWGDPGQVRITERVPNGTYLHVINILRLIAETFRQGLMDLPGIDKDTAVNFAIFHDLAKVQPELEIGSVIDPRTTFEPGYLHAQRGADLAEKFYKVPKGAAELIRYHHHSEEELPKEFPRALLPMHRYIRLLDGLSAAITRRNAEVSIVVNGSKLIVTESNNPVPWYNRRFAFDLYTGACQSLQ